MKNKFLLTFLLAALFLAAFALFSACSKGVDYTSYISEKRYDIYAYEDDGVKIKIYLSEREQPFAADGIKGDTGPFCEVFASFPKTYRQVEMSVEGHEGEMNYRARDKDYYLSFSCGDFGSDSVEFTLITDGESKVYTLLSLKCGNVLSCEQAVLCVAEHDPELFESLTKNRLFDGEIFVRLLYDEGCYYYVGICDKSGAISAYLLDGEHGKVIAAKKLSA